jgi:outer membrane immunogenic protein
MWTWLGVPEMLAQGSRVKTLALVGVSALGLAAALTSVAVADGYDAPARRVYAAPFSWTGFYFGEHDGMFDGHVNSTYIQPPNSAHSTSRDIDEFGGHIGYQHQFGSLVAGVEAAYSVPTSFWGKDTWGTSLSGTANCLQFNGPGSICQNRINSTATAGLRLGWAHDRFLMFASGGWAYGSMETRTSLLGVPNPLSVAKASTDGWYYGGGVEYALTNHIIYGLEYQHLDLGSGTFVTGLAANNRTFSANADVVRMRFSILFGGERRYEPLK